MDANSNMPDAGPDIEAMTIEQVRAELAGDRNGVAPCRQLVGDRP
jgi:hypothetical protein